MKKLITLFFFLPLVTHASDTLTNAARIGALGRNQFVDNGLQVNDTALFKNVVWVPAGAGAGKVLTSSSNGIATWQLPTAGSLVSIGDSIGSATAGSLMYIGTNGKLRQNNTQLFWDSTNAILNIGTNINLTAKVGIRGSGTTSATYALRVQNNDVTPLEMFNVRNDGRVGILTSDPATPLTIGNPLGTSFTALNNTGTNSLSSRIDQNNFTTINIRNSTSGTNAYVGDVFESTINGSPGQSRLLVAALSNATTNEYVGGEGNSAVIYYKHLGNTTDAKMKFAVTDATSVNNIKFEWISKLQSTANNALISGIGAVGSYTPIMTLVGSGSLLLGTTTEIPSSILTLNSNTKGFLPPRMTTAQRDAIASPVAGLLIFNISTNKFSGYDGSTWHDFH
jgi:hypothetical protein